MTEGDGGVKENRTRLVSGIWVATAWQDEYEMVLSLGCVGCIELVVGTTIAADAPMNSGWGSVPVSLLISVRGVG